MEPADRTLDRLLVLDGAVMEMGGGFWVSIKAVRIEPAGARPHGVNYSLCLFGPDDERIICFDNAHPVAIGRGGSQGSQKGQVAQPSGQRRVRPHLRYGPTRRQRSRRESEK